MSTQRIVTVIGATGTQGGAVAHALLADGTFAVRAVTRNMHSPKAEALTALGAEVVQASLDDQDSLLAAFDGAYGAYLVTPFWWPSSSASAGPRSNEPSNVSGLPRRLAWRRPDQHTDAHRAGRPTSDTQWDAGASALEFDASRDPTRQRPVVTPRRVGIVTAWFSS